MRQDNRGRHKLSLPWEGPYVVVKVLKRGTYKLANEDGEELTNSYVASTLRKYFVIYNDGSYIQQFFLLSTHPMPQLAVRM
jgi:hypothetical protein